MADENGQIAPDAMRTARAQRQANLDHWDAVDDGGIGPFTWTERGPGNIGGRCRSIVIHPTIPSRIYVGSVGGGVWRTVDGGTTWEPLGQRMGNIAIGCLAMSPTAPNTIYAGTGEGYNNIDAIRGEGIWRTTDGGNTWTQLPSTVNFGNTNRIAISPTNANVILAATGGGIQRSTDGGTTWTTELTGTALQVLFDPTDGNKAVASVNNSIRYSTNGGDTWLTGAGGYPTTDRTEICYAPANANWVYANIVRRDTGVTPNTFTVECWRSTDGGANWSARTTAANAISNGAQWWYDNCIWVDPTNSNNILVGAVVIWRSTDGGATFTAISRGGMNNSDPHSDVHFFANAPGYGTTNTTLYVATDGSLYRTNNVLTATSTTGWTRLDAGLQCIQYYGVDGLASGVYVGGTQDNGTHAIQAGNLSATLVERNADGTYAAIDANDPSYIYGATQFLAMFRSTDGGATVAAIRSGLTDVGEGNSAFVAPFILAPSNSNVLYAGGRDVWRCGNAKAVTPTWSSIRPALPLTAVPFVSALATSPFNSATLWVGYDNGYVARTIDANATTPTWTTIDTNSAGRNPLPNRFVTDIAVDPINTNRAIVTLGGFFANNVWLTPDNGTTWNNISGTGTTALPSAPVYAVAIHPTLPGRYYVATQVGVFATSNGGDDWSTSHDGPNDAAAYDICFLKGSTDILVGTHGRGMWTSPIREPGVANIGAGCAGSNGTPVLSATGPRIGFSFDISASNLVVGQPAWLVQGVSTTTWFGNALPFELTPLGAPGCFLRVSADIIRDVNVSPTGTLRTSMPIAANTALLGRQIHLQMFSNDPTRNAWGKVSSNALTLTIGQ